MSSESEALFVSKYYHGQQPAFDFHARMLARFVFDRGSSLKRPQRHNDVFFSQTHEHHTGKPFWATVLSLSCVAAIGSLYTHL
jgi:hypothetical protein